MELAEQYLVSPMTGEKLPASKVAEHMRIGLLDPRWVEERDKQITKVATEDQVFAPGKNKIDYNLNGVMKLPAFSHHIQSITYLVLFE